MKFKTDEHFVIGKQHTLSGKPCQDYALSAASINMAVAVVCDGCSTGGATDVGARLLAHSTLWAVRDHWNETRDPLDKYAVHRIGADRLHLTECAAAPLGLAEKDLLATSCYAYLSAHKGGYAELVGDGAIALRFTDGTMQLTRFTWANNTPCYPAYANDDYAAFIEKHTQSGERYAFTEEVWNLTLSGEFILAGVRGRTVNEGIGGARVAIDKETIGHKLDAVAVFSDGVSQLGGLDWKDVVRELLSFKTRKGDFAKRRMNRLLKDNEVIGQYPADDIAYAVILVEREGEGEHGEYTEQTEEDFT